jgi:hypothetical protein
MARKADQDTLFSTCLREHGYSDKDLAERFRCEENVVRQVRESFEMIIEPELVDLSVTLQAETAALKAKLAAREAEMAAIDEHRIQQLASLEAELAANKKLLTAVEAELAITQKVLAMANDTARFLNERIDELEQVRPPQRRVRFH